MNASAHVVAEARSPAGPDDASEHWPLHFEHWSQALARQWRAVVAEPPEGPWVLLSDRPADRLTLQHAQSRLRRPLRWVQCDGARIDRGLAQAAADYRALAQVDPMHSEGRPEAAVEDLATMLDPARTAPVVRLLGATLHDALHDGASDVHLECHAAGAEIRFRIDGVMAPVRRVEGRDLAEQIVSRLKVMAELDIGERRLPQDGRFQLRVDGRLADFRLSIMPSSHGEDAVVRLLDRRGRAADGSPPSLEALGFDAPERDALRSLARLPHGMLLVTGPTGSGKTTTLYAAIAEIQDGREKIITIEDPVEAELPGVVQIPVNEKKGLTFARGLRSILRHDPDRVMVGEIRDPETAQIAVQAALTGHLVFSTVHANHPFDVIGRLMHMGLDLYHVVSALNAVLAQRLLRINCPNCSVPTDLDTATRSAFGLAETRGDRDDHHYRRGRGCSHCRGTGYKGRRAVAELLRLDDELRDLIAGRAPMSQIKAAARARGMRSLRDNALAWVTQGHTTIEELQRVTRSD